MPTINIRNESELSKIIVNFIKNIGGDAQRHEDKYNAGIPDLSYGIDGVGGWIELKVIKNTDDIFKCRHFTEDQRNWLITRGEVQPTCFLLVFYDGYLVFFRYDKLPIHGESKWIDIAKDAVIMYRLENILTVVEAVKKVLTGK